MCVCICMCASVCVCVCVPPSYLAVVCGQDGDLLCRVTHEAHETKDGHHHLRLTQVLVEVGRGLNLTLHVCA